MFYERGFKTQAHLRLLAFVVCFLCQKADEQIGEGQASHTRVYMHNMQSSQEFRYNWVYFLGLIVLHCGCVEDTLLLDRAIRGAVSPDKIILYDFIKNSERVIVSW